MRALFIQYSTGHPSVYNADEVPSVFKMAHEMILPQLGMWNPLYPLSPIVKEQRKVTRLVKECISETNLGSIFH